MWFRFHTHILSLICEIKYDPSNTQPLHLARCINVLTIGH